MTYPGGRGRPRGQRAKGPDTVARIATGKKNRKSSRKWSHMPMLVLAVEWLRARYPGSQVSVCMSCTVQAVLRRTGACMLSGKQQRQAHLSLNRPPPWLLAAGAGVGWSPRLLLRAECVLDLQCGEDRDRMATMPSVCLPSIYRPRARQTRHRQGPKQQHARLRVCVEAATKYTVRGPRCLHA